MTLEQMETSAWLNRAFYKEKKVRALRSLLERDRARAQGLAVNYEGIDKGHSDGRENGVEAALQICAETSETYDKALCEYDTIRREVSQVINGMHDDELEALLTYRYLEGLPMEEIAERMHYSARSVKYKHKQALDKVCTILHCIAP
ncbi:sigma factor-like helix-turn-helix DNA-binding protein [Ruminococcus sp.]|uniref:sigma factor-like helix-turn-helix DNA-binding protein n=1 Tax=Ruminococcus sp. TaxID=41978 RepID=UPI00261657FE|nr:sigma factor-like helix-turn-helix DNA-binding protein [Ruminococcus sp.]MDD7556209.1 sigma factor-like helix-turn-helix DNA-binding protein [Ruminococcus sp.]